MKTLISLTILATTIYSQYTSTIHQEQMAKLAFMIGDWQGSAWMMGRSGKHEIPIQTEKVTWQLDRTLIIVEGIGLNAEGQIVHHAMAMITWNQKTKQYDFRTALASGRMANATAKFNEKSEFQWFLDTGSGQIIYTITDSEGKWVEKGEMEIQGVKRQIFAMTLNKI